MGDAYVANGREQGLNSLLATIFAHHMSDGTMLSDLAKLSDRAFAERHVEIILHTSERAIILSQGS